MQTDKSDKDKNWNIEKNNNCEPYNESSLIQKGHIRSFQKRRGKITRGQRKALEKHYNTYCIPYAEKKLNFSQIFDNKKGVILEIGFGKGEATAAIAEQFPDYGFIGIEVHTPGVGKLLSEIEKRHLCNMRIIQEDAVFVLQNMIPDLSLSGVHIFYPDPWPKKRHHKRRLIQPDFLEKLSKKIMPQGYIYAVTDWENYGHQILCGFNNLSGFTNPYCGFSPRQKWRPETRYEQKGIDKKHDIFEVYVKKQSKIIRFFLSLLLFAI